MQQMYSLFLQIISSIPYIHQIYGAVFGHFLLVTIFYSIVRGDDDPGAYMVELRHRWEITAALFIFAIFGKLIGKKFLFWTALICIPGVISIILFFVLMSYLDRKGRAKECKKEKINEKTTEN